ncbi:MAG TPA: hypothetical protein VMF69_10205 [Gemmataceae bacterium]|nr:hypothetical protein [Gemmataceae bacterium]
MNTKQLQNDFPEDEAAIYGVALSLDAFLLNGIPCGVLQQSLFPGFLEKVAGNLLRDLARLEAQAPHAPIASHPKVTESLTTLRARCQQLIDLVTGLSSFRSQSLEQLHTTVFQIPLRREACVRQIQELEEYFQVPRPFYQSRPAHSTAAVNNFLADLDRIFIQECNEPEA